MGVSLTTADLGAALDVLEAANCAALLDDMLWNTAVTLGSAVGLDVVLFADVRGHPERGLSSAPAAFPSGIPLTEANVMHAYWSACPVAAHSMPGGLGTPARWTDLISRSRHRSVPYHTDVWDPLGAKNGMGFTLPLAAERALCFALLRSGSDFSDRDVAVLTALRPRLRRRAARLAGRAEQERVARPGAGPQAMHRLTPREEEVLALVARGFTSTQIARRLGNAARTVDKHVEHIMAKLGTPSRASAAALHTEWVGANQGTGPP
jgi:DNA-binding CsgD family transcriptional regulator